MRYMDILATAGAAGNTLIPALRPNDVIEILGRPSPLPWQKLTVGRVLGNGGSGVVYSASADGTAHNELAIKMPRVLAANCDLLWEARFSPPRQLRIPGAAEYFGTARARVSVLSDVEIVVGVFRCYKATMASVIGDDKHNIDIRTALRWVIQASKALEIMGIVHRDIKPDNLFIDDTGNCRVGDYGIAIPVNPETRRRSSEYDGGYWVGTPEYCSPEQWSGDETVDHRSDIYSLGLVLYELVTRRMPRIPRGDMRFTQYGMILSRTKYMIDLPLVNDQAVCEVIAKATRASSDRRYPTHRDFQEACKRALLVIRQ